MLMEASNSWCLNCAELQQTLRQDKEQNIRNFALLKQKIIASEADMLSYEEKLKSLTAKHTEHVQSMNNLFQTLNKDLSVRESKLSRKNDELKKIQKEKEDMDKLVENTLNEMEILRENQQNTHDLNQQLNIALNAQEKEYNEQKLKIKQLSRQVDKFKNNNNNNKKCQNKNNEMSDAIVKAEIEKLLELSTYLARTLERNNLIPKKTNCKIKKLFQNHNSLSALIEKCETKSSSQFLEILSTIGINKENICVDDGDDDDDDNSEDEADGDLLSKLISQDDSVNLEESIASENSLRDGATISQISPKVPTVIKGKKSSRKKSESKPEVDAVIESEIPKPKKPASKHRQAKQREIRRTTTKVLKNHPPPENMDDSSSSDEFTTEVKSSKRQQQLPIITRQLEKIIDADDDVTLAENHSEELRPPSSVKSHEGSRNDDDNNLLVDNILKEMIHDTRLLSPLPPSPSSKKCNSTEITMNDLDAVREVETKDDKLQTTSSSPARKIAKRANGLLDGNHSLHRRQTRIRPVTNLCARPQIVNSENSDESTPKTNDGQQENIRLQSPSIATSTIQAPCDPPSSAVGLSDPSELLADGKSSKSSRDDSMSEPLVDIRAQKQRISLCNGFSASGAQEINNPSVIEKLQSDVGSVTKVTSNSDGKVPTKRKYDYMDSFVKPKCIRLDNDQTIDDVGAATNGVKKDALESAKENGGFVSSTAPEKDEESVKTNVKSLPNNAIRNSCTQKISKPLSSSSNFVPVRTSKRIRPVASVYLRKATTKSDDLNSIKENVITSQQPLNDLVEVDSIAESKEEYSSPTGTNSCHKTICNGSEIPRNSVSNGSEITEKDELFYDCRSQKRRISLCNSPLVPNGNATDHASADLSVKSKLSNSSVQPVDLKEEILNNRLASEPEKTEDTEKEKLLDTFLDMDNDQSKIGDVMDEEMLDATLNINGSKTTDICEEKMSGTLSDLTNPKTKTSDFKAEKTHEQSCDLDATNVGITSDRRLKNYCDDSTKSKSIATVNGAIPVKPKRIDAKNLCTKNGHLTPLPSPIPTPVTQTEQEGFSSSPKTLTVIEKIVVKLSASTEDFSRKFLDNSSTESRITTNEEGLINEVMRETNPLHSQDMKKFHEKLFDALLEAIFTVSHIQKLGKVALCRFFCAICRINGDVERVRVLCHDLLCYLTSISGGLIVHMVALWPEILHTATDEDIMCITMWFALLNLKVGVTGSQKKYVNSILPVKNLPSQSYDLTKIFFTKLEIITREGTQQSSATIYEIQKSIELVALLEGWHWTSLTLIDRHLVPRLKQWQAFTQNRSLDSKNNTFDTFAATIVTVTGLVCRKCPPQGSTYVRELMKYLNSLLEIACKFTSQCRESGIWKLQEALVEAIMQLHPFNPEIASLILTQWLPRNNVKISLRLKTLMAKVADKLNNLLTKNGPAPFLLTPQKEKKNCGALIV